MRFTLWMIVSLFAVTASGEQQKRLKLSASAAAVIKPLMELRIKQANEEFTEDGHWRGESRYTEEVDRRFDAIMKDQSRTGDEAIAYLLTVYMGEHQGEDLVCEATNRGKRMVLLIQEYSRSAPAIGLEPLPKFVVGSGILADEALGKIAKGEKCEYE